MPCIDRFHHVSSQNKQRILDFERYNRINQRSDATIKNYSKLLCYFARHLKTKTFKDSTKQDVEEFFTTINYSPSSQDMMKIGLRFFYRWLYDLEKGDRLPECVRWLKTRGKKQIKRDIDPKKLKMRVVTEDQYNKLMELSRGDLQAQAMIETLFWYGCRVGELLSMKMNCIEKIDIGVTVTVLDSKTQPREITVTTEEHYPQALMTWLDNHPNRGKPDSLVWISTETRTYHRKLDSSQAERITRRLGKQIGRRLIPHDFRHTAISRDCANGMPWTFVATKHGLEKNSDQQVTYDHSDHEKFLEQYRKKKDIVIEPTYNELKTKYQSELEIMKKKMAQLTETVEKQNKELYDHWRHREEQEHQAWLLKIHDGKTCDPGVQ